MVDVSALASPAQTQPAWRWWAVVGLILLIAAGVRLYQLDHRSFWMDEFYTLENANGYGFVHPDLPRNQLLDRPPIMTHLAEAQPWWRVWEALRHDIHPPLYFLLVRFWMELAGESVAAVRGFSVLLSLIAVGLLAVVARRLHGPAAGLWAAALMALATPQIHHAQDARAYPLLLALGLGACLALVAIEQRGSSWPRLIGLCLCALGLALTHYFAVGALAALGLYALLRLRRGNRARAVAALAGAGVLFLILWGPSMWAQQANFSKDGAWIVAERPDEFHGTWRHLAEWPVLLLGTPVEQGALAATLSGLLYVLPLLLVRRRPDLWLWWLWLVGVIAVPALLDLTRGSYHLFYVRYVILASPAVYALFAALLIHARPWLRHLVPAAALTMCLASLPRAYDSLYYDTNWIAEQLRSRAHPGDVLVYPVGGHQSRYGSYLFLTTTYYLNPLPGPVVFLEEPVPPRLEKELRQAPSVWLFAFTDQSAPEKLFPTAQVVYSYYSPGFSTLVQLRWPKDGQEDHGAMGR